MSISPIQRYNAEIEQNPHIQNDDSQRHVLAHLQRIYIAVLAGHRKKTFFRPWHRRNARIKGCYIWGDVGRGKTYLLDVFYDSLPFPQKQRLHFYRFMANVQASLKKLPRRKDPLKIIAKQMAKTIKVLCLDEFMVTDIADAMILAELLTALFAEGLILVTTSNIAPQDLYLDGLQRKAFLPAIALLTEQCEVVGIDQGVDYRRIDQHAMQHYYTPLEGQAALMQAHFDLLTHNHKTTADIIRIHHRNVPVIGAGGRVVWFECSVLCGQGRAKADYLFLIDHFDTIMLSNVEAMAEANNDVARRFIELVDTLYDADKELIVSAAVPIEKLYRGKGLAFEFERTKSRLIQMQQG